MSVSRKEKIFWGAAAVIVAALLLVVGLFDLDPARAAWFPKCPFLLFTGWECPGCGSSRAIHALIHGHFGRAAAFNPLLLVGAPYALVLAWLEYGGGKERWPRLRQAMTSRTACLIILGVVVSYGVLRNF